MSIVSVFIGNMTGLIREMHAAAASRSKLGCVAVVALAGRVLESWQKGTRGRMNV